MPNNIKLKYRPGEPVKLIADNSFIQDSEITEERVFYKDDDKIVINRITIAGNLVGFSSPLVIEIVNDEECEITIEYEEPNDQ